MVTSFLYSSNSLGIAKRSSWGAHCMCCYESPSAKTEQRSWLSLKLDCTYGADSQVPVLVGNIDWVSLIGFHRSPHCCERTRTPVDPLTVSGGTSALRSRGSPPGGRHEQSGSVSIPALDHRISESRTRSTKLRPPADSGSQKLHFETRTGHQTSKFGEIRPPELRQPHRRR